MAHLDNHIEAVTEHLVALDNFKTSLLQRAFRPDGCGQVMRLGDLFTLEYGRALRKEVRASGSIQVFGSAGPTGFHDVPNFLSAGIVVGRKGVDSRSSFMTPIRSDLDVVRLGYSGWGGAGAVRWAPGSHWVIDTAYEVKPVSDSIGLRFLFWLLVHANLPKVATKTTLPGLSREAVYSIKVAVADAIDLHIEAIEELDRTQIANISEAHTLTVLRSSLLQGLLIGEISINSVYDRLLCEVA
jgi:type I restriction enzyme S subunit